MAPVSNIGTAAISPLIASGNNRAGRARAPLLSSLARWPSMHREIYVLIASLEHQIRLKEQSARAKRDAEAEVLIQAVMSKAAGSQHEAHPRHDDINRSATREPAPVPPASIGHDTGAQVAKLDRILKGTPVLWVRKRRSDHSLSLDPAVGAELGISAAAFESEGGQRLLKAARASQERDLRNIAGVIIANDITISTNRSTSYVPSHPIDEGFNAQLKSWGKDATSLQIIVENLRTAIDHQAQNKDRPRSVDAKLRDPEYRRRAHAAINSNTAAFDRDLLATIERRRVFLSQERDTVGRSRYRLGDEWLATIARNPD